VITRRNFVATLGALAGAAVCGPPGASSSAQTANATRRRLDRIGIQLYTVRGQAQRDLSATFARLATIGYREVEFAGYYGRSPLDIRATLDRHGLAAPSMHGGLDLVRGNWDKTLDDAAAVGHRFVTINWLPPEARRTLDDWRRIADDFNGAGEKATARGIGFAHHNYEITLQPLDGVVPLDLLLERTQPSLVSYQMDVYWLVRGGGDPVAYVRKYPGRFSMLHIKDSSGPPAHSQVDVGAGTIDFQSILSADLQQGASIKHVFVEHDDPSDPFDFAKKSFDYLKTLEY
jgi:sugar phosphate isomerase/epimerase